MHVQCSSEQSRKAFYSVGLHCRLEPDTKNHGCKVYLPMHCARAQGLELYANAEPCNEIVHCNSCPIFTLAAEQVLIHCTTAPRNANLFLSAHREQIDPILTYCTLLIASECNPVLCSPRASADAPASEQQSVFAHRERVQSFPRKQQHTAEA